MTTSTDVIAILVLLVGLLAFDVTSLLWGADSRNLDLNTRTYPPIVPLAP